MWTMILKLNYVRVELIEKFSVLTHSFEGVSSVINEYLKCFQLNYQKIIEWFSLKNLK